MELDNLKAAWQKTGTSNAIVSDNQIQNVMTKVNDGVFKRLISWEKLMLKVLFACVPIFVGTLAFIYLLESNKSAKLLSFLLITIFYVLLCVAGIAWQLYKINYLQRIDFIKMDIVTLATRIAVFRKYVNYELIITSILGLPFIATECYYLVGTDKPTVYYILTGFLIVAMIVVMFSVYKAEFYDQLRYVQRTIKEIKEFDNNAENSEK